ncbi:MAG TPA: hypothetical protein VMY37_40430 [Thermoguttaceae bacterium]|nr:hypothetical protein [Thermoguttaceae bacterium]
MNRALRNAFSLMEVLLATSILLASLIVLGQLATVGRMHARDAERLTTAQLLCQSKLNEILAGVERVRPVEQEALAEAPGWVWSAEIESVEKLHLASLRVTVSEDLPELEDAADGPRPKQFTLTRWIRDPNHEDTTSPRSESPLTAPIELGLEGGELP